MNLIEQQNILKGLSDESLQDELSAPSGSVPPFLVLSEIGRRKDQRARYEGEQARREYASTVAEDAMVGRPTTAQMSGMGTPAAMPAMTPSPMAPMPQGNSAPSGIAAFADGGMVGGLDYADIERRYATRLEERPMREDRARALALMAAGFGIAGGDSPYFFQNVGRGAAPAVEMYDRSLRAIDSDESDLLRDALGLNQSVDARDLAAMQFEWQQAEAERNRNLTRESWGQPPASIQEFQAFNAMTPEEQESYLRLNPPYNPNAITQDMRVAEQFDSIFQQVERSLPPLDNFATMGKTPEEIQMLVNERLKQAQIQTYFRIKASMGIEAAAQYARQAGLSDGDVVTGGAPGATPQDDPLDLGL